MKGIEQEGSEQNVRNSSSISVEESQVQQVEVALRGIGGSLPD